MPWTLRPPRAAAVHRLMVAPHRQGQGLGRRLVEEAERLAAGRGYTAMRLDAFAANPSAVRLYGGRRGVTSERDQEQPMKTPTAYFVLGLAMFAGLFVFFAMTGVSLPGSSGMKIGLSMLAVVVAGVVVAYRRQKNARGA